MNFKDDVLFYLSKGRVYNGVNIYEDEDAENQDDFEKNEDKKDDDEEKCPKCGKKKCECDEEDDDEEEKKAAVATGNESKTITINPPADGFTPEEIAILKKLGAANLPKTQASKSTGTKGGDDGDDNCSVATDKLPGKFSAIERSRNSEEDVEEPKDPTGTGRNSCDTEKKNSLREEILAHLDF